MATRSASDTGLGRRFLPAFGKMLLLVGALSCLGAALSVLGPPENFLTQIGTILFPVAYSAVLVGSLLLVVVGLALWLRGARRGRRGVVLAIATVSALVAAALGTVEYIHYSRSVQAHGGSVAERDQVSRSEAIRRALASFAA